LYSQRQQTEDQMTDRTYRVTEIVGTSPNSVDEAVRNGLRRAAQTLRHLDWFEVTEIRGQLDGGEIAHYQIGMKVGFRLEDS
jgi:flavin-binding protein dodecin